MTVRFRGKPLSFPSVEGARIRLFPWQVSLLLQRAWDMEYCSEGEISLVKNRLLQNTSTPAHIHNLHQHNLQKTWVRNMSIQVIQ